VAPAATLVGRGQPELAGAECPIGGPDLRVVSWCRGTGRRRASRHTTFKTSLASFDVPSRAGRMPDSQPVNGPRISPIRGGSAGYGLSRKRSASSSRTFAAARSGFTDAVTVTNHVSLSCSTALVTPLTARSARSMRSRTPMRLSDRSGGRMTGRAARLGRRSLNAQLRGASDELAASGDATAPKQSPSATRPILPVHRNPVGRSIAVRERRLSTHICHAQQR
jgi:hypothetical protein